MNAFDRIALKKGMFFILFLLIIGLSAFIFNTFYKSQSAITKERDSLAFTGTIEAKSAMASFKVPGKIDTLFVDEGNQVEKGQELASLESHELAAKLTQARGAHTAANAQARQAVESISLTSQQVETAIEQAQAKEAQAEVGLKDARQLYDRMAMLHESKAISDKSFDDSKNGLELAQNKLEEAQGALDQAVSARTKVPLAQAQYEAAVGQSEQAGGAVQEAQAYLDNTHMAAPMSGYITQKILEQGEMVNAGTPVFEVTDLLHTYVKVYISEKKIGRVHLNQDAEISVDALPGKVFKGKVVWINNAGDFAVRKAVNEQYEHDLRSFETKIDVPNPDLALQTGMTATVRILEEGQ